MRHMWHKFKIRLRKFREWFYRILRKLFCNEWELTVFFSGETTILQDGSRITSHSPKSYRCKKMIKLSPKHIVFIRVDNTKHEIKTTEPVGYDLRKIH
jgi:hypothetical protein